MTDSCMASISAHIACILDTIQSYRKNLEQTAKSMGKYIYHKFCDIEVYFDDKSRILNKYLQLMYSLSYKYTSRFVRPFKVLEVVASILLCFDLLEGWHIQPIFHLYWFNPSIGSTADLPRNQFYLSSLDTFSKLKAEYILDICVSRSGLCEFCIS